MNGLRAILVKADNDYVITDRDSIDVPCHGMMAPELACNITGAVGLPASVFNSAGLQVWRPQVMEVKDGKIIRRTVTDEESAAYYAGK